jgi:hypothetical protein
VTYRQFLRRVWRWQRQHGYVFLTWFDDDHDWHDHRYSFTNGKAQSLALPNDGCDVYFAPNLFESKRRKDQAKPGRWLYADLDEVDPRTLEYLLPTIAWETSPGRYQAMWQLTEHLQPNRLAELNQQVTYFTGADRGGWSLTKVLRVPGTVSTKHGFEWTVRLMWADGERYDPADVRRLVRDVPTPASVLEDASGPIRVPKRSPATIRKAYRGKLPATARKLLKATEARGDRSQTLWKLYNLLLDAGMSPGEVFVVIKPTVWNKYRGQSRENRQLWTEIHKAEAHRRKNGGPPEKAADHSSDDDRREGSEPADPSPTRRRRLVSYDDFLKRSLPRPRWLVESIWSEDAHGILAGPPKSYKSVIATDLAVSVASGTPFLDHFSVPKTGPVIIIQEENDPGEMQDRLQRIAHSRALTGAAELRHGTLEVSADRSLPIGLLNNEGFDLTSEEDIEWLEEEVNQKEPVLLILDPFYLMTPGMDENSASDVTPILKRLLRLKQHYDCGVLILHHHKKSNAENPTTGLERMSGTGVFGRWFESALICERPDPGEPTVRLVPHHRSHAPQGVTYLTFDLGTEDDLEYSVDITRPKEERAEKHAELAALVEGQSFVEFAHLRKELDISADALTRLLGDHGWGVARAASTGGRPKKIAKPLSDL